jgi:hypothetical protein
MKRLFGPLAVCIAALAMLAFPGCSGCVKPAPPVPPVVVPDVPEVVTVRTIVILRDTMSTPPAVARLVNALRSGEPAKQLRERDIELEILSVGLETPDNQPSPRVARYLAHVGDTPLPAMLVLDSAGELITKKAIDDNTTASDVLALADSPRDGEQAFASLPWVDCDFASDPRFVMGDTSEPTFEGEADEANPIRGPPANDDEPTFGQVAEADLDQADEEPVFEAAVPIIPREQWPTHISAIDAAGGGLDLLVTRIYDQGREGSCTSNATCQSHEILQNAQYGPHRVVHLSAISLYKRVGSSPMSGSSVSANLRELRSRGALPVEPCGGLFPHCMSNTGFSQRYPSGWEATAKLFKGGEYFEIRSYEGFITALLRGYPVVYGRQGHAICAVRPVIRNGRLYVKYANSWHHSWGDHGFGYDSESQIRQGAQWAFALRSVVDRDVAMRANPRPMQADAEPSFGLAP